MLDSNWCLAAVKLAGSDNWGAHLRSQAALLWVAVNLGQRRLSIAQQCEAGPARVLELSRGNWYVRVAYGSQAVKPIPAQS